jgi:hypothetical protein
MKWPGGPLEIARLEKQGHVTPETKDLLQSWLDPSSLDLLQGTVVNCLVVNWAAGIPQDREQQSHLTSLVQRGREVGVEFIGWVEAGEDVSSAVASARAAGLSAIASEKIPEGQFNFPIVPATTRSKASWSHTSSLHILTDGVWPQIRSNIEAGKDVAVAGPTGIPWVNSNGWYMRLSRTLSIDKTICLAFDPPGELHPDKAEPYLIAMADAEAYGAHWVISLSERLRGGMAKRDPKAMETWRQITNAAAFFRGHADWNRYQPQGILAVLSDFSRPNEFMSGEILNLLCRRHLPFRVITKDRVTASYLDGLKAIIYADADSPKGDLREELLAFVKKGGLLIAPSSWKVSEGTRPSESASEAYDHYKLGEGRIVVAKDEWQDPYQVATEVHLIMGHSLDLLRLWNAGGTNSTYTVSPDGKSMLVQIVNYSGRPETDSVSLWLNASYRSARFWNLEGDSIALNKVTELGKAELHLPAFGVYAAVELET